MQEAAHEAVLVVSQGLAAPVAMRCALCNIRCRPSHCLLGAHTRAIPSSAGVVARAGVITSARSRGRLVASPGMEGAVNRMQQFLASPRWASPEHQCVGINRPFSWLRLSG